MASFGAPASAADVPEQLRWSLETLEALQRDHNRQLEEQQRLHQEQMAATQREAEAVMKARFADAQRSMGETATAAPTPPPPAAFSAPPVTVVPAHREQQPRAHFGSVAQGSGARDWRHTAGASAAAVSQASQESQESQAVLALLEREQQRGREVLEDALQREVTLTASLQDMEARALTAEQGIQELLTHQRRAQQLVEQMVVSQRAVQAENDQLRAQAADFSAGKQDATEELRLALEDTTEELRVTKVKLFDTQDNAREREKKLEEERDSYAKSYHRLNAEMKTMEAQMGAMSRELEVLRRHPATARDPRPATATGAVAAASSAIRGGRAAAAAPSQVAAAPVGEPIAPLSPLLRPDEQAGGGKESQPATGGAKQPTPSSLDEIRGPSMSAARQRAEAAALVAPTSPARHVYEECDFNIFTGELYPGSETVSKRNRLTPETRMAWLSGPPRPYMSPGRRTALSSAGFEANVLTGKPAGSGGYRDPRLNQSNDAVAAALAHAKRVRHQYGPGVRQSR